MRIRKPTKKDKESLARLYLQFWEAHPMVDPLITLKKKPTLKWMIEFAEKDLRKKDVWLFVAEEKNSIVGVIELMVKKNHKVFKVKRFGYINTLVVDKRCRKKGIGKLLVKKAIQFFRQKKIKYVRTNIYFSNRIAVKAWPKMKFRPESIFMIKKI